MSTSVADVVAVHLLLQPVCPRGHGSPSSASVWGMQRPRAELAEPRGQLAPRALFNSVYARFRREQN